MTQEEVAALLDNQARARERSRQAAQKRLDEAKALGRLEVSVEDALALNEEALQQLAQVHPPPQQAPARASADTAEKFNAAVGRLIASHSYDLKEIQAAQSPPLRAFEWEDGVLPPSANMLVRPAAMGMARNRRGKLVPRMRLVKTTQAEEWLTRTQAKLKAQVELRGHRIFVGVPLRLQVIALVPSIKSDATNRFKALEDAMTGIVWADDCQVVRAEVDKFLLADFEDQPWVPTLSVRVSVCEARPKMRERLAKAKVAGGGE